MYIKYKMPQAQDAYMKVGGRQRREQVVERRCYFSADIS